VLELPKNRVKNKVSPLPEDRPNRLWVAFGVMGGEKGVNAPTAAEPRMKYESPSSFQTDERAKMASPKPRVIAPVAWVRRIPPMFTAIVIVPTIVTAIYYLFIAAPIYQSEAQFVIRQKTDAVSDSAKMGGGSMLQSMGMGGSDDQTAADEVIQYMQSRDAVADLERRHNLRAILARPQSDFLSRFPRPFEGTTFEDLFHSFQRFLTVGTDTQTEINTVKVNAYTPEDAHAVAEGLLEGGEELVNRMNARSLSDTVGEANRQLADAEAQAAKSQTAFNEFRNRERIIDPTLASQADVELLTGLQSQVASLEAQRSALAASAPQSPQLPVLDRSIAGFQAQIAAERERSAGRADSLAPKLSVYDRLLIDQNIAGTALNAAETSLEGARLDATRKQLYLERVVNPDQPDYAMEPKRIRMIFTVFICALVAYAAISLLVAGLREHRQE
jgi:BexC/CtrB/KpsE family polysaccharide export inner-membrane protein